MKFNSPPRLVSRGALFKYLEADFWTWALQLFLGLSRVDFLENFDSFRVDNLVIPAGQEVSIPNQFKQKRGVTIPTSRLIVRQTGNGLVIDGDTPWTTEFLYLKNTGLFEVTISTIFFR